MTVSPRTRALTWSTVVCLGLVPAMAAAADPTPADGVDTVEIDAFSTIKADVRMIQTGEASAAFVGSLTGTLYIDGEKGPVAQGALACIGMFNVSLSEGSQQGSGSCTVNSEDGAQAFGTWTCEGFHLVGCQGPFKVTGGTGRLAGLTGEGPVTIRSNFHALAETADGQVVQSTEGIVFWQKLKLSMPSSPVE